MTRPRSLPHRFCESLGEGKWVQGGVVRLTPLFFFLLFFPSALFAGEQGLFLEGESYRYDREKQLLLYQNPRAQFDGLTLLARSLVYDKKAKKALFQGNIFIISPEVMINASVAEYDLQSRQLTIQEVHLYDKLNHTFIESPKVVRLDQQTFAIEDAEITVCRPEESAWHFYNSSVIYRLDDYAQAFNTTLFFHGAPIFYSPYFAWPTKKGRASGVLAPNFLTQRGNADASKNWGTRIQIPYFIAIDRDQDATLTFDFLQNRGLGLGFEYRYAFTPGMSGRFNLWELNENRNLDPAFIEGQYQDREGNWLPGTYQAKAKRFRYRFDHRQKLFGGQFFVHRSSISDNEIYKEFDNAKNDLETHQTSSTSFVYSWAGGGANLSWAQTDQFTARSIYDTSTNKKTYLNSQPNIRLSHRFTNLLGSGISIQTSAKSVKYVRQEGWNSQWNQVGATASYPFNLDFLNIFPSLGKELYRVNPYYLAQGQINDPNFIENPDPVTFAIEKKRLEVNFEVYRLFYNRQNKADARLGFRPRLIYEEVEDVDQRGLLGTYPGAAPLTDNRADFTTQGYSTDYSTFGSTFETPVYGQKVLTTALSTNLLTKKNGRVQDLLSLELKQPYNLNRMASLEEQNRRFKGPQLPEDIQETSPGNQKMPLRATFSLDPSPRFHAGLFYRYGHEEKKVLENSWDLSIRSELGSQVGLTYRNNRKAYKSLDGLVSRPHTEYYQITPNLRLTPKLHLVGTLFYDLSRRKASLLPKAQTTGRLNRSLNYLQLGLTWKQSCYDYFLGYEERLTEFEGQEAVEQRVTFSLNLASWPGSANPFQNNWQRIR